MLELVLAAVVVQAVSKVHSKIQKELMTIVKHTIFGR